MSYIAIDCDESARRSKNILCPDDFVWLNDEPCQKIAENGLPKNGTPFVCLGSINIADCIYSVFSVIVILKLEDGIRKKAEHNKNCADFSVPDTDAQFQRSCLFALNKGHLEECLCSLF